MNVDVVVIAAGLQRVRSNIKDAEVAGWLAVVVRGVRVVRVVRVVMVGTDTPER